MNRFSIKIAGASGGGLLSTGDIILKALQNMGFYLVAEREYPSVIKGGHACFNITASEEPVYALREEVDLIMAIDSFSLKMYIESLKDGGILVHGQERVIEGKETLERAKVKGVKEVHLPIRTVALESGGNVLMSNVVLLGMMWKALGLEYKYIEAEVTERFKSKPKLLEADLRCLKAGFEKSEKIMDIKRPISVPKTILMEGNKAIALGAVHAGCRAYFAYPMSPASTILTHMANFADKKGLLVKQVEDEISVASMTLGAMHMGTRAFCATSGGGYDLMTETVSLAGMIECPLLICIAQRPGPATGMPTWTCQADLDLAIYSAHGEFTRLVVAVGDPSDAFDLTQHAFNYAEKFQIPVVLLTEKGIAETHWTIPMFEQGKIPIERGLVEGEDLKGLVNEDRFRITESGVSKRWVPGASEAYYFANSDEHLEDGSLTEDAEPSRKMIDKRMRKMGALLEALPEPEIYGEAKGAVISFVGWGSSKNVMRDIIKEYAEKGVKVNYLHYSFVFPLKTEVLKEFFKENKNVNLIEGNYQGQLGNLIEAKTGLKFKGRLLKYDGRPFYLNDLEKFIDANK